MMVSVTEMKNFVLYIIKILRPALDKVIAFRVTHVPAVRGRFILQLIVILSEAKNPALFRDFKCFLAIRYRQR